MEWTRGSKLCRAVPGTALLVFSSLATATENGTNSTAVVTLMSAPWDRILLLGFFGTIMVLYLSWFAWHMWQGTLGVLLWRLGVAPEAFACLNVASTIELISIKARRYKEATPAIVLGHRNLGDQDILRLAEGVRKTPGADVYMLDLSLNFGVSTSGVQACLQALFDGKAHPAALVEELDLSGLHIDPLAAGLFEAPLQQLTLKGCGLEAKQLVGIMLRITTATGTKQNTHQVLSHLDLSYNDFGALKLDVKLPPLQVLALESCNLRDTSVEALLGGKGKLVKAAIMELNLSKNTLTDASAKLLAAQLPNSKVQSLDIRSNRMTVKAFAPFLQAHEDKGFWCRIGFQGNTGIPDEAIREFHDKFVAPPVCEPCDPCAC